MITCLNKFYNLKDYQNVGRKSNESRLFMINRIDERNFTFLNDIIEFTKCKWLSCEWYME